MQLVKYTHEKEHIDAYISFLRCHYANDPRIHAYLKEVSRLLDADNPFFKHGTITSFLLKDNGNVVGHASAIIDSRNKTTGMIGFYDCVENAQFSDAILDACNSYLRENRCSTIRGPINLTIWHNYRFAVTHKRAPALFDPFCKPYYVTFWKRKGFTIAGHYISCVRQDFSHVLPYTKEAYDALKSKGLQIRTFRNDDAKKDMQIIFELANDIFRQSWNFVMLSFDEFMYLYAGALKYADSHYIEIVETSDRVPVGFCFSMPNPYDPGQLILKTIGVKEDFRRQNIAAAILYSQHAKADKNGFRECYYPLIRTGNNVTKFPYGGYEIITEYATFEAPVW